MIMENQKSMDKYPFSNLSALYSQVSFVMLLYIDDNEKLEVEKN
jgi:hypothetical protein